MIKSYLKKSSNEFLYVFSIEEQDSVDRIYEELKFFLGDDFFYSVDNKDRTIFIDSKKDNVSISSSGIIPVLDCFELKHINLTSQKVLIKEQKKSITMRNTMSNKNTIIKTEYKYFLENIEYAEPIVYSKDFISFVPAEIYLQSSLEHQNSFYLNYRDVKNIYYNGKDFLSFDSYNPITHEKLSHVYVSFDNISFIQTPPIFNELTIFNIAK